MTKTDDLIGNFADYVTEAANRRVRTSIDGTSSTATKKELYQSLRIRERGKALIEDPKVYSRMVHKLIDHHQKETLALFNTKGMEIVNKILLGGQDRVALEKELQEVLTESIWRLEKLVEDDLVRTILGPEGGN